MPGLGSDPTPGVPELIGAFAGQLAAMSAELHNTRGVLRRLPRRDGPARLRTPSPARSRLCPCAWTGCAGRSRWPAASSRLRAVTEAAHAHPDLALDGQPFDTDGELAEAQHRLDRALVEVADAEALASVARAALDELVSHGELLRDEHQATAERAALDLVGAASVTCG
jgi:hypothetical protein